MVEHLQGSAHFVSVQHAQERRLLQLDPQRCVESVIEYWIGRRIGEVGKDNRVVLRQLGCVVPTPVQPVADGDGSEQHNGSSRPLTGAACG